MPHRGHWQGSVTGHSLPVRNLLFQGLSLEMRICCPFTAGRDTGYCHRHILDCVDLDFIRNGCSGISARSSLFLGLGGRLLLGEIFLILDMTLGILITHCHWRCLVLILISGYVLILLFLSWLFKFFLQAYLDTDFFFMSWPALFHHAFVNCSSAFRVHSKGFHTSGKAGRAELDHHWMLLMLPLSSVVWAQG